MMSSDLTTLQESHASLPFRQLFISAMGPPGGGRNDVTSRFIRHLNVIGIDEFQDEVLNKIFGAIVDWHFAKGFDTAVARFGRVRTLSSSLGRVRTLSSSLGRVRKAAIEQFGTGENVISSS